MIFDKLFLIFIVAHTFLFSPNLVHAKCIECDLTAPQLIQYNGYPSEIHNIKTADGYTLQMHRIPYSPKNKTTPRPPVLLQHGLLDSSVTWIINLPTESLGYLLSDAGFDVWLGNNRGNYYSPPAGRTLQDWSFSYDEMGKYDLPAFVSYVLNVTGYKSLGYVGHSEGCTQAFAGLSINPILNQQINFFVALAPAIYENHQTSALIKLLANMDLAQIFLLFGVKDFFPESPLTKIIGELFCAPHEWTTGICEDIIFALCGKDTEKFANLNESRIEIYIAHTPAGTSVQNMVHWAQAVEGVDFKMYDYGSVAANEAHYNQATPPLYNLTNITVPMGIFAGGQDDLADPADMLRLLSVVPPSTVVYFHTIDEYDHLDFTWGVDAAQKIYTKAIELLKQHSAQHP